MKTLFLHIGRGKTGTTAQQKALAAHRETLLAQGIDYILAGDEGRGGGHQDFAKSFIDERPGYMVPPANPEALRAETARQIVESPAQAVLLSSENFPLVNKAALKAWIEALGVIASVRVILFARSQDELAESEYNQMVKVGAETGSAMAYAETLEGADFFAEAEAWAAHFGRDAMIARLYDGKAQDALAKMASCLPGQPDLQPAERAATRQGANRSLGARALTVARLMNGAGVSDHRLRHPIFQAFDGKDRPAVLFTAQDAATIRARFAESNRRFARRYLGNPCDGDLGGRRYDDATRDRLHAEAQDLFST
ncbi:hypothetical protein [Pacificoceanicola onchidii]|uniref:hypothetical protein n=1 Tax=Pacificoceanicola onchidii TaxID=2562685 RepID=UPI0010A62815|nr:hypothetical protein [Pacificoceanicola onchidii]